ADLNTLSSMQAWRYLTYLFLHTYIEFSAYSDIAIGASLLFGIVIRENFDFPILASNVGEYWKRWHMSLSSWCQAYIYMPTIGVTRSPYLAVFLTMMTIGLWHAG